MASYLSFNSLGKSYLSFNRIFFRNRPIRNKNCLWQPRLLTDRDKMSNRHRGPSIYASYQVSVQLGEVSEEKFKKTLQGGIQRQYELLPSLGVRRLSSVYFSHFNLL
jgi:hypothetical protein